MYGALRKFNRVQSLAAQADYRSIQLLDPELRHALKLRDIVCDERRVQVQGVRGDQQVHAANGGRLAVQV